MAAETTRMERLRWLHKQIQIEINKYASLEADDEEIANIRQSLETVDKFFFSDKIGQFIREQQEEKPYLDTAKNNITISEEEMIELKRIQNDLKNIETNYQVVEGSDEEEEENFFSEESQKYQKNLNEIAAWLEYQIDKFGENEPHHHEIIENVSMTLVHQVRGRDGRSLEELRNDLNEVNFEVDAKRFRFRMFPTKTKQFAFIKVLFPILAVALILIAVGIALSLIL